jgi:hypothetical protein
MAAEGCRDDPGGKGDGASKAEIAAQAIATGKSFAEAAVAAGVSSRTLYSYRQRPDFSSRVVEIRNALFAEAGGKLARLAGKAADRLEGLLQSQNEAIAIAAVKLVLGEMGHQEVKDLEARLNDLVRETGAKVPQGPLDDEPDVAGPPPDRLGDAISQNDDRKSDD